MRSQQLQVNEVRDVVSPVARVFAHSLYHWQRIGGGRAVWSRRV